MPVKSEAANVTRLSDEESVSSSISSVASSVSEPSNSAPPGEPAVKPKKRIGRPKGSKNKKKRLSREIVTEEAEVEASLPSSSAVVEEGVGGRSKAATTPPDVAPSPEGVAATAAGVGSQQETGQVLTQLAKGKAEI